MELLTALKKGSTKSTTELQKDQFPRPQLYKELHAGSENNIKNGFKKAGLVPLNKNEVLKLMPDGNDNHKPEETKALVCDAWPWEAGKSVSIEDFEPCSSHIGNISEALSEGDAEPISNGNNENTAEVASEGDSESDCSYIESDDVEEMSVEQVSTDPYIDDGGPENLGDHLL